MKNKRRKNISRIAIFVLLLSVIISSVNVIVPTASAADLTGMPFIIDVALYEDRDPDPDPPANETKYDLMLGIDDHPGSPFGLPLGKTSGLRIEYSFEIASNAGIVEGDTYTINLPEEINVPSPTITRDVNDTLTGNKIFDFTVNADNTITIVFTDHANSGSALIGSFYYSSSFNGAQIQDFNSVGIEFDLDGGAPDETINLYFSQPELDDIDFSKELDTSYSNSDYRIMRWAFILNDNNNHEDDIDLDYGGEPGYPADHVVITDVLHESLTLYNGAGFETRAINIDESTPGNDVLVDHSISYDPISNELTVTFNDWISDTVRFEYYTFFDEGVLFSEEDNPADIDETTTDDEDYWYTVDNGGTMTTRLGDVTIVNRPDIDIPIDFIDNAGTSESEDDPNTPEDERRHIDWTITVNPRSNEMNGTIQPIVVTDEVPDGLQVIEGNPSHPIYFEYSGTGDTSGTAPVFTYTHTGGTPDTYTFTIAQDIDAPVYIHYSTEAEPTSTIFTTQQNETFDNTATVTSSELSNNNTGTAEGVGMPNEVMNKWGTTDIGAGIITWYIEVNPNEAPLDDMFITDLIEPADFTFLGFGNGTHTNAVTNTSADPDVVVTYNANPDDMTDPNYPNIANFGFDEPGYENQVFCEFPANITETFYIVYQTQINNPEEYTVNDVTEVTNVVEFTSTNATGGPVTGTAPVDSEIIEKTRANGNYRNDDGTTLGYNNYNYDTREMEWRIQVNQNENTLTNCRVWDNIPADMVLITDSLYAIETSSGTRVECDEPGFNSITASYFEFVFNDSAFVTAPDDFIDEEYYIYFLTRFVDETQIDSNDNRVRIENTAYIEHDDLTTSGNIPSEGAHRITSSVIEKSGGYVSGSGDTFIDWTVLINRNHVTIDAPDATRSGPVVYDQLQEGLSLAIPTIKLYNATVAADNSVTRGSEVAINSDQITYNEDTRELEFEFASSISEAYYLEFRTEVVGSSYQNYGNEAYLNSEVASLTDSQENVYVDFANAGGYATRDIGRIVLTKEDSETGDLLNGGVFEIRDAPSDDGNLIATETTGDDGVDGQLIFDFIYYDFPYYYREITPPPGYAGDPSQFEPSGFNEVIIRRADVDETNYADDPDRSHEVTITNDLVNGTISFEKRSSLDDDPIEGCVFTLYSTPTNYNDIPPGAEPVARATSDVNGDVLFEDVAPGRYTILEEEAPDGYIITHTYSTAEVRRDSNGYNAVANPAIVYNDEYEGSITLTIRTTFSIRNDEFDISLMETTTNTVYRETKYANVNTIDFLRLEDGYYNARIMPNRYGYVGLSNLGYITAAHLHDDVYLYLTRTGLIIANPQTGTSTDNANVILIAAIVLLSIGILLMLINLIKKRKTCK